LRRISFQVVHATKRLRTPMMDVNTPKIRFNLLSVESSRTARLGDKPNEKYQSLYSFIPAIHILAYMWAFLDSGLEFVKEAIEVRLIAT
jgi:hypothetical protein